MPLLELYETSKQAFEAYRIGQIVGIAGDGKLRDGGETAGEIRQFLKLQESQRLFEFVEQCLSDKLDQGGFVFKDLVNELGRRLDFEVENGLYQGRKGQIGHDGKWISPEGHTLIVEVKTTDAYRINLDVLADYRRALAQSEQIQDESSILIVVGRQDTGDLEAQVRGSKHAWDIRLISAEALAKLIRLKEEGDRETAERIRLLLITKEFTRLDELIDTLFETAEDIRKPIEEDPIDDRELQVPDRPAVRQKHTQTETLNEIRSKAVKAFSSNRDTRLLKHSKAKFWSADRQTRVCCTISKFYERNSLYWYAYHQDWDEFLAGCPDGFLILGCVERPIAIAMPRTFMASHIRSFNMSTRPDGRKYWHLHLGFGNDGSIVLKRKGGESDLSVREFAFDLSDPGE